MYHVEFKYGKNWNDKPKKIGHRAFHDKGPGASTAYDDYLKLAHGHYWNRMRIWNQAARRVEGGVMRPWVKAAYNSLNMIKRSGNTI